MTYNDIFYPLFTHFLGRMSFDFCDIIIMTQRVKTSGIRAGCLSFYTENFTQKGR